MNTYCILIFFLCLSMHHCESLRCRSGNQQLSDNIRKTMQKCRHQQSNSSTSDDDYSTEDNSDENISSDSTIFDDDFFSYTRLKNTNNNSNTNGNNNSNNKDNNNRRNVRSFIVHAPLKHYRREQMRPYYTNSPNQTRGTDDRMRNNNNNNYNNRNYNNQDPMIKMPRRNERNADDDSNNGKSCIAQCFFDELNLVDRQGLPEQFSVTKMMLQGIYDPLLRDFIEESIIECFHFLQSERIHDKCTFSRQLLNCFADKGRERCEDWNG